MAGTNFLNTKDLAEKIGISVDKARALMNTSGFPSIRIGHTWHVSEDALSEWERMYRESSFDPEIYHRPAKRKF